MKEQIKVVNSTDRVCETIIQESQKIIRVLNKISKQLEEKSCSCNHGKNNNLKTGK